MKKAKKATSSSAKNKAAGEKEFRRVLIPLVSGKENDEGFITEACAKADELVLLLVVDTEAMPGGFGFAASEIGHGNLLMEEIKAIASGHGVDCNDLVEWGDTTTKIMHLIQLKEIKNVFLIKQENEFFKKLVKALREEASAEVEIFELPEKEEE